MKTVKNIKLTKAEKNLKGFSIPKQGIRNGAGREYGNVGKFVENVIADLGYETNNRIGIDIPKLNIEIKTKNIHSRSAYGIGVMHIDKIIENDYDSSLIKEKLQTIFIAKHDQNFREICNARTLDFQKEEIQNKLRYAYNSARDKIISGDRSSYIKGDNACAYFENKRRYGEQSDSWSFRIPINQMEILESLAKSNFDNICEII